MLLFKYDNVTFKYIFGIIYEFIIIYQHKIKIFYCFIENMLQFYLYRSIIINTKKH